MTVSVSRRSFIKCAGITAGALMAPAITRRASAQSGGEVNVIGPALMKVFKDVYTQRSGIQVNEKSSTDAAQVFNLLAAEGSSRVTDVVTIPNSRLWGYIALNMLEPLDEEKLSGLSNIKSRYLDDKSQRIKGHRYGVPFLAGVMPAAYRNTAISVGEGSTWKTMFDEKFGKRLAMRPGSALMIAQRVLGNHDTFNKFTDAATCERGLAEARDFVISHKHLLRKWYETAGELQQLFVGDEIDFAQGMSEGVNPLVMSDASYSKSVPVEGTNGYTTNICILKGAPNMENAYNMINAFLTEPNMGASIVRVNGSISTFKDELVELTPKEQAGFGYTDEELARVWFQNVDGPDDPRYVLLDKYTAGIKEA